MSERPEPPVGGSALPAGVMMRIGESVAVAVRDETGRVRVESFHASPARISRTRLGRLFGVRALLALRASSRTASRALRVMGHLMLSEESRKELGERSRGQLMIAALAGALIGVVVQFALFRLGPLIAAKEAGLTGAWFILAEAGMRLGLLLGALRVMVLFPSSRRLLAYHGAEHMAIACHEAGEVCDVARIRRHSRFHARCGTSFLVGSGVVSVAVYGGALALTGAFSYPALILTRIVLAPLVSALALEGQRVVARGRGTIARVLQAPGIAAQRLTTHPPGDDEIAVARAALIGALDHHRSGRSADTGQGGV